MKLKQHQAQAGFSRTVTEWRLFPAWQLFSAESQLFLWFRSNSLSLSIKANIKDVFVCFTCKKRKTKGQAESYSIHHWSEEGSFHTSQELEVIIVKLNHFYILHEIVLSRRIRIQNVLTPGNWTKQNEL